MATLAYRQATKLGIAATPAAADIAGDKVPVDSRGIVVFRNGDAASKTVTVATPGNDEYGQARPDYTVTVAAGQTAYIGPFSTDLGDAADNRLVALTYSAVTSCTVDAVRI